MLRRRQGRCGHGSGRWERRTAPPVSAGHDDSRLTPRYVGIGLHGAKVWPTPWPGAAPSPRDAGDFRPVPTLPEQESNLFILFIRINRIESS
ncbi:protein of unknown function [Cupriavidus taiwanensis]|nr:protein of unknown function [Cupriavidus taiwanensis]